MFVYFSVFCVYFVYISHGIRLSLPIFACLCLISLVGVSCTDAAHSRGNTSHGYYIHLPQLKKSKVQLKQPITITSLFIVLCKGERIRECSMATQTTHLKTNNLLNLWNSVNTSIYVSTSLWILKLIMKFIRYHRLL